MKVVDKKSKFLIVMFLNDDDFGITLASLISLICYPLIYLLPKFNILYYIFLLIILNLLIYLILRTLFKKVESYIKLIKPFNFLKCYLPSILFFTIFSVLLIIAKYLNDVSSLIYQVYIPFLTYYSILFFVLIYIFFKEIKLSEFEKYSDLSFGDLGKYIEKGYYNFYASVPWLYIILFYIIKDESLQLLLLFIALIEPIIITLGVITFFEKSTYLIRKTLIELSKLQKDNIDELIKH